MSQDEWIGWVAFYEIEAQERALEQTKANARAKAAQKRGR